MKKVLLALGVSLASLAVFAAVKTTFYGPIDMQNNKVINVADPTANKDAANKQYVDTGLSAKLDKSGDIMSGNLNMGGYKVTAMVAPTQEYDAANKGYVDGATNAVKSALVSGLATKLDKSGGTMSGVLDMGRHFINGVSTPTGLYQAVNQKYLKANFLPLSGTGGIDPSLHARKMSGTINMGRQAIIGLPLSTNAAYDAARPDAAASQQYVKGYADTKLSLSGGTMLGDINMSGHAIHNLRTPVRNDDAATRGYVNSVINNANSYQYFALKKGSGFTPIYNLGSNTNRWFDVKVVRQFTGSITSYYENIRALATPNFPNKTWKVGETIKVLFSLGPETFVETNGTLIVKGPSGVLGNFGITAPPNGISPFTCDLIVNGTTYAPNTGLSLNTIWDNANKCFTFKLVNTSGRTISNAVITAPAVVQYVSSTPYTSTQLFFIEPSTYTVIPGTLTISSWANNMELTFKLYVIDIYNDYGFRWNFNISADGQSYDFGQFFYYIP